MSHQSRHLKVPETYQWGLHNGGSSQHHQHAGPNYIHLAPIGRWHSYVWHFCNKHIIFFATFAVWLLYSRCFPHLLPTNIPFLLDPSFISLLITLSVTCTITITWSFLPPLPRTSLLHVLSSWKISSPAQILFSNEFWAPIKFHPASILHSSVPMHILLNIFPYCSSISKLWYCDSVLQFRTNYNKIPV